ncbi:hypothetical protein J7382_06785 [Shimia sp. R11_0]|uniref:hypothetical protein n=1 Tax=Shimia sp. R11_0 TaxID=2821096 RepID=UPI001ADBFAA9|nr:hypothetical protein [Shimia sp. R11_0]MBO9477234.1 hypothetical protein [Shimia sp. R11_0]
MSNITLQVRQALTEEKPHTSKSIAQLIAGVLAEAERLTVAVTTDKLVMNDIAATERDQTAAQQRLGVSEVLLERLTAAVPRLRELQSQITLRERDERQKTRYDRLVKRRSVVGKQLAEFLDCLPAFATALHEAVQLREEARAFNERPTPGTPVNPMDDMVSDYLFLAPLVTDAVLQRTRLVGSDGKILFAPIDSAVRAPLPKVTPSTETDGLADLKERLRYERDMQTHVGQRLQHFQHQATIRGVSLEHVAASQGVGEDQLERFQKIADGKMVEAAEHALSSVQNPTT